MLIESTILRAALTEDNALGIDLVALSGINFSSLASGNITTMSIRRFKMATNGGSPVLARHHRHESRRRH